MDLFDDTLSKGKKNDHMFHNTCTTHIVNYNYSGRVQSGKLHMPFNIVWKDNCPRNTNVVKFLEGGVFFKA